MTNRGAKAIPHELEACEVDENAGFNDIRPRPRGQSSLVTTIPITGFYLVALGTTIASMTSPCISTGFEHHTTVSWLGSAHLAALAAIKVQSSQPSDPKGKEHSYFAPLLSLVAANFLSGLAPNQTTLITGRILSGVGAGLLSIKSASIVDDLVSPQDKPSWQSLTRFFWILAIASRGGIMPGNLPRVTGWTWSFGILVPYNAFLAVGAAYTLVGGSSRTTREKSDEGLSAEVDAGGSVLLMTSFLALMHGLNLRGHDEYYLFSTALLVMGVATLIYLVTASFRVNHNPILRIHLPVSRAVAGIFLCTFYIATSFHVSVFYTPLSMRSQDGSIDWWGAVSHFWTAPQKGVS